MAALKNSPKTKHLSCTLVEGSDLEPARQFVAAPPEQFTNRIVSLTPATVEFMMAKSGNWDFVDFDRIKFYDNMVAYDGQDAEARIHFDASTVYDSHGESGVLAAMCEVVHIQSSLLAKIDQLNEAAEEDAFSKAEIIDSTKVTEISRELGNGLGLEWPVVTLDSGERLQARLLVGADGQNSPVRAHAGIVSRGWNYDRFGVVGTLKLAFEDYRLIAWQRFLTTGPLAILPLPDDNATFVWSSTPELAEVLLKVHDDIFPHLLTAAMVLEETDLNYIYKQLQINPADMLAIDEIKWRMLKIDSEVLDENFPVPIAEVIPGSRARFPLKFLHADSYIAPRVALIGDAAHTVHPLAGQGLNMGQTDVAALVSAIETGVDRGLDIGSPLVLEPFVAQAWPANHVLMGVCDKLHKIFSTDFAPVVFVRGLGLKSLNMIGGIKELMIRAISGH